MSVLPNTTKHCFRGIKAAIAERIAGISENRNTYSRFLYADNINQWVEVAAVSIGGESVLRAIFIYLSDFSTSKKENGYNSITANYQIEVVYGHIPGDDNNNSTQDFEDELGGINDLFLDEEALGFTDSSSNPVLNSPITGEPGDGGARPQYIDGVLAHRKILNLEVVFRLCKGG